MSLSIALHSKNDALHSKKIKTNKWKRLIQPLTTPGPNSGHLTPLGRPWCPGYLAVCCLIHHPAMGRLCPACLYLPGSLDRLRQARMRGFSHAPSSASPGRDPTFNTRNIFKKCNPSHQDANPATFPKTRKARLRLSPPWYSVSPFLVGLALFPAQQAKEFTHHAPQQPFLRW